MTDTNTNARTPARIRRALARMERQRTFGVSSHAAWEILDQAQSEPVVEACRLFLATCARLCSREFFWDQFLDENPVDLQQAVKLAQAAREAVEPLLVVTHGTADLEVGSAHAASGFQAVDLIANELLRSIAAIDPDQSDADLDPRPVLNIPDDTFLAVYAACCRSISTATAPRIKAAGRKKKQSEKAPLWDDGSGEQVLSPLAFAIAMAIHEKSRSGLRSSDEIAKAINDVRDRLGLRYATENTVSSMVTKMGKEGLLEGTRQRQKCALTKNGEELMDVSRRYHQTD